MLGWTGAAFAPFCFLLRIANWLRIDPLEEAVGMDISRHKGPAYESEGSANAGAVRELNASRRNLMLDASGSSKGMKGSKKVVQDGEEPEVANAAAVEPKEEKV